MYYNGTDYFYFSGVKNYFRKVLGDDEIDNKEIIFVLKMMKFPFKTITKIVDGKERAIGIYNKRLIYSYFDTVEKTDEIRRIIHKFREDDVANLYHQLTKRKNYEPSDYNKSYNDLRDEAKRENKEKMMAYLDSLDENPEENMNAVSQELLQQDDVVYESYSGLTPETIYISYGFDKYDENIFKPIVLDSHSELINKCKGGIWACPIDAKFGWKQWCEQENYKTEKLIKSFTFKLKPQAKIYVIDDEQSLVDISTKFGRFGEKIIDFERLIEEGYDGIYATDNAVRDFRDDLYDKGIKGLNTWDVESLCVFNPEMIDPVTISCVTESDENLSDVETEWKPKEGLFLSKSPRGIANYLLKHSKDRGQAMKRLTFYMNRAGENLKNKTVLNKVKDLLTSKD